MIIEILLIGDLGRRRSSFCPYWAGCGLTKVPGHNYFPLPSGLIVRAMAGATPPPKGCYLAVSNPQSILLLGNCVSLSPSERDRQTDRQTN